MPGQSALLSKPDTAPSGAMPHTLRDYRDCHEGETILVCGCGVSLAEVDRPEDFITIGVNDVGRLFQPTYLVVLNPRSQFSGDRFKYVEESRAGALFTQLHLGISHPNIVRFRLGQRGGIDLADPDSLPYTRNSPYVGVCLALHMGARRIGLIGVDFTNDHFFGKTGPHSLAREFPQIDLEYKRLFEACQARGVEFFNLSQRSRLTALPRMTIEEFARRQRCIEPLQVVSYSVTPVAGVPVILSQCISERTSHACRTVWATHSYNNGVYFDTDIEWGSIPGEAENALRAADLVIVHNGKVDSRHRGIIDAKPVITMAHNYMWNVDATYVNRALPGVVVGQYQATLPEFRSWHVVPNPLPLWHPGFQPGQKNSELTICYTPSGKHEKYPREHRLYWHSKGYATTMRVLEALARRFPIRLETLPSGQVSHVQSLAMKQRAHIVIDECVTGSYHRNSLEGLAAGCVVVNALGSLPSVTEIFARCAGTDSVPFVFAALETLEDELAKLIEQGPTALAELGARNRAWAEQHWNFSEQWERFWEPVVTLALHGVPGKPIGSNGRRHSLAPHFHTASVTPSLSKSATVTAVVCQGGPNRLKQLGSSLASLRQFTEITEIVVVDMGPAPAAELIARRWADRYYFIKNDGPFERARSLNIGASLAQSDLVVWLDSDLLMPPDFFAKALAEIKRRALDFLLPYSQINYLSEADSEQVRIGACNPADCTATQIRRNTFGGVGIVKGSFFRTCGGIPEEFRGWGGEDDAWWHKAKLLGRAAITERRDQVVYHLFHPHGGNYIKQKESNPYYAANLAALRSIWSVNDRSRFIELYPPNPQISWPWSNKRALLLVQHADDPIPAESMIRELSALARLQIDLQVIPDPRNLSNLQTPDLAADAILAVGADFARSILEDEACRALWLKTVVINVGDELASIEAPVLARSGAIVALRNCDAVAMGSRGIQSWSPGRCHDGASTDAAQVRLLLQPLSLILADAARPAPCDLREECPRPRPSAAPRPDLPIWMYWEGECPEWIRRCQQTVFSHGSNVRLLTVEEFRKLRDSDLDIDIERLHVAQRADFIRAFLLARYGGLWLDSDCIVMRSLDPLLQALEGYEFLAHRERTAGLWANDLLGAAPGSMIAAELYRGICRTLRSQEKIGWTDLGCRAVTRALEAHLAPWLEVEVRKIQPVCWSRPEPFLKVAPHAEHEQCLDQSAVCYMLSNLTMQKSLHLTDLSGKLLCEGTFFHFLLDRSTQEAHDLHSAANSNHRIHPEDDSLGLTQPLTSVFEGIVSATRRNKVESISGPGSELQHTIEIRERLPILIQDLGVRSILDAGCGDFNWMRNVDLGGVNYCGVDLLPEIVQTNRERFGRDLRSFHSLDIARHPLPAVDLILCRDCLVLLPFDEINRILDNFRRSGSRYLLATSFPARERNVDGAPGSWRPLNFERAPFNFPAPLRTVNEKCRENSNGYSDKSLALWKLEDIPARTSPLAVQTASALTVSERIDKAEENRAASGETSSELTVVVPIFVGSGQSARLRNLESCLRALNAQDLDRSRYCIVVVEQDSIRRVETLAASLADRYIFALNPRSFNKSWGFNMGAMHGDRASTALCLLDGDLLPGRSFLREGLERIRAGRRAVRPYSRVTYLDPQATERAIRDRMSDSADAFDPDRFRGQSFSDAKGGCLFVELSFYRELNGFDERFRGFGYEDTEFWNRITRHTTIDILPGTLLHMHHPRTTHGGAGNARLYGEIAAGRVPVWKGPIGNMQRYANESHLASVGQRNGRPLARVRPDTQADTSTRTMTQVFDRMTEYCANAGMASLSGPGSSLDQTSQIRSELPSLLRDLGVASIIDAGCGDFHWMKRLDLPACQYTGIDVLEGIVRRNQEEAGSSLIRFLVADICREPVPRADLILCRDCLVHLPYNEIRGVLKNFKASLATFLLTTSFVDRVENCDVPIGGWRPLNFQCPPFDFPKPLRVLNEKCTEDGGKFSDKSMVLWRLAELIL
jgi:SAM-dependent methyltransferase/predicted glycosyltransferase involved in capsule biosynthesis